MSVAAARIAIIDYGMGNRRSVEKAFAHVGADVLITRDHAELRAADALVLPGVGAFPKGMRNLRELGLDALLHESAAAQKPILGICLGMQLLFDSSAEQALTQGLGLIAGVVAPLAADGLRVPHIGWNDVRFERHDALIDGLPESGTPFYHVHSYAARASDPDDVVGSAEYGQRFTTIVHRGSVHGVQFHPEKSSRDGLRLLASFTALAARAQAGEAA
jgi:imidazole glycerol-phosphate synthase subunit HisH